MDEVEIVYTKGRLTVNDEKILSALYWDLRYVIDLLVKRGDFYLVKKGKEIEYIIYKHWEPQHLGGIYSTWTVNHKVIYEFLEGSVN